MNDSNQQNDHHIHSSEWMPNFSSTRKTAPNASMDGIRTMEPLSNANYLNKSKDVGLNLDEQLYHNISLENVAPVEKVSRSTAAFSSKSVGQVIYSEGYMNTQECSVSVPLQQVSQPYQQNEYLQHLKRKVLQEQIQMVHQLNASSMHQQLQKPLGKSRLDKYRKPLNDLGKEPLVLNKHKKSASHQVVLPSSCYGPQEQQSIIRPHQHPLHIAQPPEVTSPPLADAVKEEPLDSASSGQHAYVDDWFIKTYMQIQMLRDRYSSEVEIIYKMVKDPCHQPPSGASLTSYQKKMSVARMIMKFLSIRKADLPRYSKDKVMHYLNVIKWHLDTIRIKRLGAMHHHEQPHPPANHSTTSQLQRNRNMEVVSNQLHQSLTNQHACSPQSSIQQGVSLSQENSISSLCNDSSVGNALCSFQNSPARSKQQSPTNYAIQTNMVVSPNVESQFGLQQGCPSVLHHGLGKSVHIQNLNTQQNPLPSTIVNSLVTTISLPISSVKPSHVVNKKAKNQILHTEKVNQPVQKSQIEKKMQQMLMQKELSLQQQKLNVQPAGYSPQSLTSSLPATDHEEQSFCAESTVNLQIPLVPVEQSQAAKRNYTPAGSSSKTSASPLSIEFDTPEISLQPQPIKRFIEVVKSMSSKALCSSLQDFNAVINLVDNIAGPTTSTGSKYPVLETNSISSGSSLHDKVNRQISATAFDSSSSFSRGTNSIWGCNQAADMVSTATNGIKKRKIEKRCSSPFMQQYRDIIGEIGAINLQLIETSLDVELHLPEDAAGAGDGTIIKCSYNAVGTLAKWLRMQYASSQTLPDFVVRWLVPADYPNSSPMLLDTLPGRWSEVLVDMSEKLVLKLNHSIRTLSHPISLEEIVRNWDASARAVFTEFAEGKVGKSLGSNLGTWENCVTTW